MFPLALGPIQDYEYTILANKIEFDINILQLPAQGFKFFVDGRGKRKKRFLKTRSCHFLNNFSNFWIFF